MILILPAVLAALYGLIGLQCRDRAHTLSFTVLVFEALLLLLTNLLSFFKLLTGAGVFLSWAAVLLLLLTGLYLCRRQRAEAHPSCKRASLRGGMTLPGAAALCMLGIMAVLSAVLLVGAVCTVPYNYDSMSYHLARIGYWVDHQSVAHYTTAIDRQLYSPVLAEYNLLHMFLLGGGDETLNLLQYTCMFAVAYLIFCTAKRMGTGKVFSLFAAFVFMLMPLTVSQSVTTQNDLFATLFFAVFVYELLEVICWEQIVLNKKQALYIVGLALCVGFAYLAKTSVCASMLMFMPWLLLVRIGKKDKPVKLLGSAALAGGTILLTIAETLLRTLQSSGSLMTDTAGGDIMVATKNVSYILVNILKNYSLLITQHLYRPLNGFVYRIAIGTGSLLHVEVNNEAIAFHGFDFLHHMNMGEDMYSHDKTPSAFAAYLALLGGVLLLLLIIRRIALRKTAAAADKRAWSLSIGFAVSAWLSFGFIMALLRWQPWGTRLMYPALAMTLAPTANLLWLFLRKFPPKITGVMGLAAVALCTLLSLPAVSYNMKQALSYINKERGQARTSYYFVYNDREKDYRELVEKARGEGVTDIGLLLSGDGYDYPLWMLFRENCPEARLRHIVAEDAAKDETDAAKDERDTAKTAPEAILMIERDAMQVGDVYRYGNEQYRCTYVGEIENDCYLSRCR